MYCKIIIFSLIFLSTYCTSDEFVHFNNPHNDVIPLYGDIQQQIQYYENILRNPNTREIEIYHAMLQLIVYYYGSSIPDYNLIKRFCLEIIGNPNINPEHARYFLAELYFKGQGVDRDLNIALRYYNEFLSQDDISNMLLVGPCSYKSFAYFRIRDIQYYLENIV